MCFRYLEITFGNFTTNMTFCIVLQSRDFPNSRVKILVWLFGKWGDLMNLRMWFIACQLGSLSLSRLCLSPLLWSSATSSQWQVPFHPPSSLDGPCDSLGPSSIAEVEMPCSEPKLWLVLHTYTLCGPRPGEQVRDSVQEDETQGEGPWHPADHIDMENPTQTEDPPSRAQPKC